ncbi:MAG TPA: V-type ATP synthase subunit D [Cytophagales bacterium]|jgi:V/A-type H+-transporting ATPase subunit D|nr:V-type ATP synthase subunit D [Cytophagales bacterium]
MALKIQYNKTFIQQLQRQLNIREKALPTLKSKETALRLEVRNIKQLLAEVKDKREKQIKKMAAFGSLWQEFGNLIRIAEVKTVIRNIAGVKVPDIDKITFEESDITLFEQPAWIPSGKDMMKSLLEIEVQLQLVKHQFDILTTARKKTTQKVNLYEKVQIPAYREGIRKIKRYLEDQENLSKAAQKIIKNRTSVKEVAL